ncbi:hypothetical protein [Aquimarina sp. AU474]|uniref:hypothetical protein n=1 Tax=Aquimarina sp. AU474 TaxID=2108529 RepID=UPI000D692ED2|nr:hypothetical protein [Aquimarina sp. AU474]
MRNLICILIVLTHIPEILAQSSLEFSFNKESISISRYSSSPDIVKIYRGHLTEKEIKNTSAILGQIVVNLDNLQFAPIVPFSINQEYTIVYDDFIEYFKINIPKSYSYLTVTSVYPSAKKIPANILKWYIQFSEPINETWVYKHVQFRNAQGDTLSRAALALNNALVSDDGKLLTIWVEPGRQKRDLIPNKQLGAVFETGKSYTLWIQKTLKNKDGTPMQNDYVHYFEIEKADRKQPEITTWTVDTPMPNSISDLTVHCNESLDYGSIIHSLAIQDKNGKEVMGTWTLQNAETILSFTPLLPWIADTYKIICNSRIEDLAGNNLERMFDQNIEKPSISNHPKNYTLDFIIE